MIGSYVAVIRPAESDAEKVKILATDDAERTKILAEAAQSHNRVALDQQIISSFRSSWRRRHEASPGLTSPCFTEFE